MKKENKKLSEIIDAINNNASKEAVNQLITQWYVLNDLLPSEEKIKVVSTVVQKTVEQGVKEVDKLLQILHDKLKEI